MTATADQIKDANARYHDVAAAEYDRKWGISYTPVGREIVSRKLAKALGKPARFNRALEIGAGTGYFTLNLLLSGVIEEAVATDISRGMLDELELSAGRLGVPVRTVCTEATELPFPDASFDLVFGHAVLHHLPDLGAAFAEFRRVLRPGGAIAFCGEPSRHGDRLAALPKRAALALAPAWRRLLRVPERAGSSHDEDHAAEHKLEHMVDVHAFSPGQLEAFASEAGLESVRVTGEELVAGWFGWANRTLESTARAEEIPRSWYQYAYRGYIVLKALDDRVLARALPPAIFYNLLVSARAPAAGANGAVRASASARAAAR
jgi:ubiquinone/menaquinone biosynthesis C-methylase UbiE